VSDLRHGVISFAEPDETIPAISNLATWRQVKGATAIPISLR
jgi:hypothetical protein